MHPLNYKGQRLITDAGILVKHSFLANYEIEGERAVEQSSNALLNAEALSDKEQSIKKGLKNPLVARNVKVTGNAAGIIGDVIISGTNFADELITESISLNGDITVEGNKAFKTVTSIVLPTETNKGTDTVSVGYGNKLGLPYKLSRNTVLSAFRDNEQCKFTVTTSEIEIENNTVLVDKALNESQINIYLMV